MPASVPSISLGKTLLVPVDIGAIGTSPHPFATNRFVPSPPRVTMQSAPASRMMRAASVESFWLPDGVCGMNSECIPSWVSAIAARANPAISGMTMTLVTPWDWRPANTRRSVFDFSWLETTRPCATNRRMSLPAAGFAIMPTVGMLITLAFVDG